MNDDLTPDYLGYGAERSAAHSAPDAPVPGDLPEDTRVLKAHYSLTSGRETFAVVAFEFGEDGVPVLPFTALEGTVFLRDVHGTLVNLATIHRIEGLPAPDQE